MDMENAKNEIKRYVMENAIDDKLNIIISKKVLYAKVVCISHEVGGYKNKTRLEKLQLLRDLRKYAMDSMLNEIKPKISERQERTSESVEPPNFSTYSEKPHLPSGSHPLGVG
jgi:hypothetical protein